MDAACFPRTADAMITIPKTNHKFNMRMVRKRRKTDYFVQNLEQDRKTRIVLLSKRMKEEFIHNLFFVQRSLSHR